MQQIKKSNGLKYPIISAYIVANYLNIQTCLFHIRYKFSSWRNFESLDLSMLMKYVLLILFILVPVI